MTGGTFYLGYDGVTSGHTSKTYPATVSDFRLDKFEVTVGRFRRFKTAWDGGWRPAAGAGKHAHLYGGSGLLDTSHTATFETGWDTTWNSNVAPTDANLACSTSYPSWTPSAGANEQRPMGCVLWYELYAFCIWDGGFLPSEAESNYAAAGGSEQRTYPWSSPAMSMNIDCTYVNYSANLGTTTCVGNTNDVGSESPKGDARYGQADVAGNVSEWNLDGDEGSVAAASGINSSFLGPLTALGGDKVFRGGAFNGGASGQLSSYRTSAPWFTRSPALGGRCARSP